MTDIPTPEAIQAAVRQTFGPGVDSDVTVHDSGAVSLTLRTAGHVATIDGRADQWGVSIDPTEEQAFTGHETVTGSLAEALEQVRRGLPGT
ncbi:hypothetical protein [Streptomyces sp. NPDC002067]